MKKLSAVLVFAACGNSNHASPDAVVLTDSQPADTVVVPGPNLVDLSATNAQYVVYRDGNGPWHVPQLASAGHYNLNVTAAFQVVIGCANAIRSELTLYGRTYDDGAEMFGFCGPSNTSSPSTVAVTGTMNQAGDVWMDAQDSGTTAPWNFALQLPVGTHDLIAKSTANRVLVRRNVAIAAATALATVDVVANGVPMTAVPLTINGATATETLTTEDDILLTHDFAFVPGTTTTLQTLPASLLQASDLQFVFVDAYTSTTDRYADAVFTGSQTSFTLMPTLSGISYTTTGGVVAASWGTLPSYAEVTLTLANSQFSRQRVTVTKGWLDATTTTRLAFDVDPPGLDQTWKINTAGPYQRSFEAYEVSGEIGYSSSVSEGVNGGFARELPNHDRRSLRERMARARFSSL